MVRSLINRIRRSHLLDGGNHSVLEINNAVFLGQLFESWCLQEEIRYVKINISQYFMQNQLGSWNQK